MKKSLLFIMAMVMIPLLSQAQDEEGNWEYHGIFPADSLMMSGVHGITVDGENKVWFISFYTGDTHAEDEGVSVTNLYVYNQDGTPTDFSPIQDVAIGDSTYLLAGIQSDRGATGLTTDSDGDVYLSINNTIIKFDHTTGDGLAVLDPEVDEVPRLAGPAADTLGNIYTTGVVGGPIKRFNMNLENEVTLVNTTSSVHRDLGVSLDGNDLFLYHFDASALLHYSRPSEFDDFGAPDTVLEGMLIESIEVDPYTGYIWVSSHTPESVMFYGYDFETWEVQDSVAWNETEGIPLSGQMPRDFAFSADGATLYAAAHRQAGDNFYAVQKYTRKELVSNEKEIATLPDGYSLEQNYPNPFNPTTNIEYTVKDAGMVTLKVYDITGREVATLVNSRVNAGTHMATFDASNLASGIYMYSLEANGLRLTNRMTLIK